MSIFAQSEWKPWAAQWGLTHIPQKGKLFLNEGLVGAHRGYLIRIGRAPRPSCSGWSEYGLS